MLRSKRETNGDHQRGIAMLKKNCTWTRLGRALLASTVICGFGSLSAHSSSESSTATTTSSTSSSTTTEWASESSSGLIALNDHGGGGGHSFDPGRQDDPQHITFRHTEFNGVGHENGYTSIDFFMTPFHETHGVLPFVDMRAHVLNNGDIAANIGIGFRRQPADGDCVWGFNLFYDWRERPEFTFHNHQFHQIGLGFEIFCPSFDLRLNGYLPVGQDRSKEMRFHSFSGHSLYLLQRTAMGMPGVELDVGGSLGQWGGIDWYAAATPFFFWGKERGHFDYGDDAYGVAFRVVAQFWDMFGITLGASIDSAFDFNGLLEFAFRIPRAEAAPRMGRSSFAGAGSPTPYDRMGQRVQRRDLIVIQGKKQKRLAKCPTDCEPYKVYHVSNTGVSGNKFLRCGIDGPEKAANLAADGTWEHPYTTLAEAESASSACNIIYVLAGDGTTTGMMAGITLKDDQLLLGGGKNHLIKSCQGQVNLPATCAGFYPKVTSAGAGVTLADNNMVSGIWIDGTTGAGISGTTGTNANIVCNKITNTTTDGINLTDYTGDVWITDNWIDQAGDMGAELVNAVAGTTNYYVYRNHVNDSTDDGINFTPSSTAAINAKVGWNVISGSTGGEGIAFAASDNAKIDAQIFHNKVQGTSGEAIEVVMNNGTTGCFDLLCNQITAVNNDGIYFDLNDSASIKQATIRNNTVDEVQGTFNGIELDMAGSSTAVFCIANNCVRGTTTTGAGLDVELVDSARLQMVADDNEFISFSGRSVDIDVDGSSFLAAAFGRNQCTGAWYADTQDTARMDLQLIENTASPGYTVNNVAGTINFEDTATRNTGPFTFTGTVTTVSEGSLKLRDVCRGGTCCP